MISDSRHSHERDFFFFFFIYLAAIQEIIISLECFFFWFNFWFNSRDNY